MSLSRNPLLDRRPATKFLSQLKRANAWTQWGKLREVMVGCADFASYPVDHAAYRGTPWRDDAMVPPDHQNNPTGRCLQSHIDVANFQLDNLASVLEGEGISVVRPMPVDWGCSIKTPFWECPNENNSTCPRDIVGTIGNVIVESAMSRRDRMFEKYAVRSFIEDLYDYDEDMSWTSPPQSLMMDDIYVDGYWDLSKDQLLENPTYRINESAVLFDVADVTKCGKDIFVQLSNVTNNKGISWLRRELAHHGVRVHRVRFPEDTSPWHIDATFVPLRPGLVMTNPNMGVIMAEDWDIFEQNGWVKKIGPKTVFGRPSLVCGPNLNFNVLVVDEDTVVAEESEIPTHEFLRHECGFGNVITVPFTGVYQFGGSIHCATWDIYREDSCVDLFPNQD